MTFSPIFTDKAPSSTLYSQAVSISPGATLIYTSGILPIDLATKKLIEGDITAKTVQVFEHIKAILQAAGTSLDWVVRVEIFCTDLSDFAAINDVYSRYITEEQKPVRQTIQVAALPMNSPIEVSCQAILPVISKL